MVEEEEQKLKIFNTVHMNHLNDTPKKKYFRIEKNKPYSSKESHAKAIFRTKKDYNFLRRKTLREIETQKQNKNNNNNKFITTTVDDTTISAQSENSFLVKNIIPRKLIITQENKKELYNFNEFNKEKYSLLRTMFRPENNENMPENNKNINFQEKNKIQKYGIGDFFTFNGNLEKFRIKLMIVHFYSIKNLCKYINKNFFDFAEKENMIVDTFINQVYQTFRILNMKINEFKIFYCLKEIFKAKIKQEDFDEINALKQNMQFMKNVLNKKMSENLVNIYINIENFCKIFSPCKEIIDDVSSF
jgi:hypothetical protein